MSTNTNIHMYRLKYSHVYTLIYTCMHPDPNPLYKPHPLILTLRLALTLSNPNPTPSPLPQNLTPKP